MRELERPAGREHPGAAQRIGDCPRLDAVETGQCGDVTGLGIARQHRDRARTAAPPGRCAIRSSSERDTVRGPSDRTAPVAAATGSAPSASRARMSSRSRKGLPPVASAHAAAKGGSGSLPEGAGEHRRDGLRTQLSRLQRVRVRGADQLGEGDAVGFGWPGGDEHADRQVVQAPREVGEEAQRGIVGPVGVVDREQERAALREVGRQPVQPVRDAEPEVRDAGVERLERRRRERGGAGEQALALPFPGGGERALEELADHAVREIVLEGGAACGDDAEPAARGRAVTRAAGGSCRCWARPRPRGACPRPAGRPRAPARVAPNPLAFEQVRLGEPARHPPRGTLPGAGRAAQRSAPGSGAGTGPQPTLAQTALTVSDHSAPSSGFRPPRRRRRSCRRSRARS